MGSASVKTSPGFVDAHSHLRSTSYADQGIGGSCLEEALLRMCAMTSPPLEDDVFVACVDLIERGVTTVQAMFHTFGDPDDYWEALDATVRGVEKSGIRAVIILGTTDQAEFLPLGVEDPGLPDFCAVSRRLSEAEFGEVVARAKSSYPDITLGVGPVGPQWCSDSLLGTLGEIASEGYRVHSHFLESVAQRTWAPGNSLERLRTHRLLGPNTSLAHAVWCSDSELRTLSDLGVQLVACPLSNRLLGAGEAPVESWLHHGITAGIGLDSADSSAQPLEVARLAFSSSEADEALTVGGLACVGLTQTDDTVVWQDREHGVVDSVEIDGRVLVNQGQFHDHAAVEDARHRIFESMQRDAANRTKRLSEIDSISHAYRRSIEGCSR